LVSTHHDPDGLALPFLELPAVTDTLMSYPAIIVAITPDTDQRVTGRLQALGAHIVSGGQTGQGRRAALAAAPPYLSVFACDFDRWLHWAIAWPQELAELSQRVARLGRGRATPWYVCLGRTARAFATHPPVQRLPEAATNRVLSLAAARPLDAVAGAAWITPEAAAIVLAESIEVTASNDLEWAGLILRRDRDRLRGLRCEGLEWETPDFHTDAVAAAGGRAAWIRTFYDTPAMWATRLRLAANSATALERVLAEGSSGMMTS
jgi:hypothetical protein